jgi:hypothetical protein
LIGCATTTRVGCKLDFNLLSFLLLAGFTNTKNTHMLGMSLKSKLLLQLRSKRLKQLVFKFFDLATFPANQVMVRPVILQRKIGLAPAKIGLINELKLLEQLKGAIDGG